MTEPNFTLEYHIGQNGGYSVGTAGNLRPLDVARILPALMAKAGLPHGAKLPEHDVEDGKGYSRCIPCGYGYCEPCCCGGAKVCQCYCHDDERGGRPQPHSVYGHDNNCNETDCE